MPKVYDNDTLSRVKACELEILKDFINVCEENNLTYFGFAGTGIGALRHGGFIPWDDDIDIAMPRADYNKMTKLFKKKFSDKYTVVNAEEFDDFPVMNTHIIINDSLFVTEEERNLKYPKGIFLDIFPLDKTAPSDKLLKKQAYTAWFFSKLLILKHIPFPHVPFTGIKAKLAHIVTAIAWFFLNLFCIPHKFLYNKAKSASCKYNNTDSDAYGFFCSTVVFAQTYSKDDIFPLRSISFEGIDMNFPHKLEKTLTNVFGDFMQLPPPEKRKNHMPYKLEFPKK